MPYQVILMNGLTVVSVDECEDRNGVIESVDGMLNSLDDDRFTIEIVKGE